MRIFAIFGMAVVLWGASAPTMAAPPPDYRAAYTYALRCFVVANSVDDKSGARRAFDAAMRLGHLQNLSNRQLNADLDHWGATELVKVVRDPAYKAQMMTACRKMGLAS